MTIIDRPLQRCSRSEMEKMNLKTEDFSDCFNEISIDSQYCDPPDLDLNAEDFIKMHDFNDVNINQLLTKSEPTETVLPPRRPSIKVNNYEFNSCGLDNETVASHSRLASNEYTSKVLGETNQILSGGSHWDLMTKPTLPMSYNTERPPSAKFSPVQYATCYPATTTNATNERNDWSSPKPASPESLLPAFSNFSCNAPNIEHNSYTGSDAYSFNPTAQSLMVMERLHQRIPEPPNYYQSHSTTPPMDNRLMSSEPAWTAPPMPPLHPMGIQKGYSDSTYSSPTGSMSELHNIGRPINHQVPTTASCSMVPSHPAYLSQSFPGASPVHNPVNRTGRSASGSAGTVNSCSIPFVPQTIPSCQSSPVSQGSPAAPTGCHGSWSDIPMTYQSYVANGGAASSISDLELESIYMSEERTSPVGDSLTGDILLPDDGMLSPSRSLMADGRRVSRTGVRRMRSRSGSHSPKSMELWQFLWVLLAEQNGGGAVMWLDKPRGVFKVVNQVKLCELWSDAKRRNPERTKVTRYSNLTRTLRYYYQRGLMKKGERDHVYQFIAGKIDNWVQARARSATH